MKKIKRFFSYIYKQKIINFSLSFLVTLGLFLLTQPKRDQAPAIGFSTIIYNQKHCYNIHHWVYMMSCSLLIVSVIILSHGIFVPSLIMTLGCLTGGSFSDIYYRNAFDFTSCDNPSSYKSVVQ